MNHKVVIHVCVDTKNKSYSVTGVMKSECLYHNYWTDALLNPRDGAGLLVVSIKTDFRLRGRKGQWYISNDRSGPSSTVPRSISWRTVECVSGM